MNALEIQLRAIVDEVRARGIDVRPGASFICEQQCCLLGAAALKVGGHDRLAAETFLGIDYSTGYALESGFEGWCLTPSSPSAYCVGQRMRAYCAGEVQS